MGQPARGYSWPPFEKGHTKSLKHGVWSARTFGPVAEQLVEEAVSVVPWLAEPSFQPAVWAWARAEAKVRLLDGWLEEHGVFDEDGEVRNAANLLIRFERLAMKNRERLGLDPQARVALESKLSTVRSQELEAELAEGRRLRLANESS